MIDMNQLYLHVIYISNVIVVSSPSCLDWSEICDGKIDCIGGNVDEEYCWQLEIHQCNENEYQCSNGQCISNSIF